VDKRRGKVYTITVGSMQWTHQVMRIRHGKFLT
jgi:hypothetical protein